MKSIINNEHNIIIKNSKFICLTYQIHQKEEIMDYLENAKKLYPNATHYCYAYIIDGIKKESDDGEPSGTAGIPILQVLERNNLEHILCIVIRYFGKIKLGANGLIRAYTNAVTSCIKDKIIELEKGYVISISFPYSMSKKIDYILANSQIQKKEFKDIIKYEAIINQTKYNELKNLNIIPTIIKETYITIF